MSQQTGIRKIPSQNLPLICRTPFTVSGSFNNCFLMKKKIPQDKAALMKSITAYQAIDICLTEAIY
jgi:hypothetical protein